MFYARNNKKLVGTQNKYDSLKFFSQTKIYPS